MKNPFKRQVVLGYDGEPEDELGRRLRKHGSRGIVKVGSPEGYLHFTPEQVRHLIPADSDDDALYRRVEEYGTRGIIEVPSAEGGGVHPDAVQYLKPAED